MHQVHLLLSNWFVATFASYKATSANIATTSTSTTNSAINSSSGGYGLSFGRIDNNGNRISLEYSQNAKSNNVQNNELSVAYDAIFKTEIVNPILGLDIGYNNYALTNYGATNTFNMETLGLRAGIAKSFGHNQIELLYRYSAAIYYPKKNGNTTYVSGTDLTTQSISNYKANEIRLMYSYRF